jgi:hypothetical protein
LRLIGIEPSARRPLDLSGRDLKGIKYGISAASYPTLDISNVTLTQAQDIYEADYWAKAGKRSVFAGRASAGRGSLSTAMIGSQPTIRAAINPAKPTPPTCALSIENSDSAKNDYNSTFSEILSAALSSVSR